MKYLKFMIYGVFFYCSSSLFAQRKNTVESVEEKIAKSISKGYEATVYIIEYDTAKNEIQQGAGFSGVVVSPMGNILTVSHAANPGQIYQVSFPSGKKILAKGLGRIGIQNDSCDLDLAMIKITEPGDWPYAKMGSSSAVNLHQPAISIAYPSTFESDNPFIRFGRITNVKTEQGYLQSSCKMEPGDSGGPLFDEFGQVIGLHSWINQNESENFEVPIDLYLKYWTALNVARDYKQLPSEDAILPTLKRYTISQAIEDPKEIFKHMKKLGQYTGLIESYSSDSASEILATIVKLESKTGAKYAVSKSSMVFDSPIIKIGKKSYKAKVINRDRNNDLVLLELSVTVRDIPALSILDMEENYDAVPGKLVFSTLDRKRRKVGVVSRGPLSMPLSYSIGYFGANATYIDNAITITQISEGSAASQWLKLKDKIIAINGIKLSQPAQYGAELARYMAGESISIDVVRSTDTIHLTMSLPALPGIQHISTAFEGGRSQRSDGFENVFVQDAAITSKECGSPVFDGHGNFLGLNIARHSRTSSIVMPAKEVRDFVKAVLE